MKLKKIGLSCLLLAAFQFPAFAEDEIERMNRIREEERRQFDQDQRNREQDERNRRDDEQRFRDQNERQREADRIRNEQRNAEWDASSRAHKTNKAADRAAADREAADRAAAGKTAEQQDAADMEWLSYPDEDLDTMARLYIAKINANPNLSAEARIRLQNKYLLEIARMKKDKAMRESRLLEVERQKMDIERQRLEIELLRAKLAADAKQAPAGK
jgi:hypothetical protein